MLSFAKIVGSLPLEALCVKQWILAVYGIWWCKKRDCGFLEREIRSRSG
jgi:hypothetical protein